MVTSRRMVTTRSQTTNDGAVLRAMHLAKQRRYTQAIQEFTRTVGHTRPLDYLMLHTAAAISLQEFDTCLRTFIATESRCA